MPLTRIETSDFSGLDVFGLPNAPSEAGMGASALKARFDALAKDLLAVRINEIVDALNSTGLVSGASYVGFSAIPKANFTELQSAVAAAFDYVDQQIANAVFGEVSPSADNITVADAGGFYTGTNVEAVLAELHDLVGGGVDAYDTSLHTGALADFLTANATASKVIVSNASGKLSASALDSAILAYLSGITSNVQTQLNGKMSGTRTVSTGYPNPSSGADGDLWFRV